MGTKVQKIEEKNNDYHTKDMNGTMETTLSPLSLLN